MVRPSENGMVLPKNHRPIPLPQNTTICRTLGEKSALGAADSPLELPPLTQILDPSLP